jgi:hypothetical protein
MLCFFFFFFELYSETNSSLHSLLSSTSFSLKKHFVDNIPDAVAIICTVAAAIRVSLFLETRFVGSMSHIGKNMGIVCLMKDMLMRVFCSLFLSSAGIDHDGRMIFASREVG